LLTGNQLVIVSTNEQSVVTSPPASESEIIKKVPANETSSASSAGSPNNTAQAREKRWYTPLLSPLWLCLLAALIIRTWLTVRTQGILDADEALVGIQAQQILHGDFPIYFYGIPYFGSLEAYLVSILFAIFGSSVWALRAVATILSLVLVCLTWWLASLLAETARLPLYARRCFTIVAALVAAIPPLYDGIIELRTWGGWIETFVLMLLLLISVFRLTSRWREGASSRELALRWAGIGFIVGLGMWVYPLIATAILAAAIWIIADRIAEIIKLRKDLATTSEPMKIRLVRSLKRLLLAVAAIPTCLLGFLPGILWGATHQWENIRYIRSLGGSWSRQRLHTVALVANMYKTCVAPRVISGATPLESKLLTAIHSPLLILGVLCIFATVALVVLSFVWHHPLLLRAQRLAALPTLFGACTAVLFCTGSASASILISCNDDFAGRYAAPLVLALPFFFATTFTLVSMFIYEKSKRPVQQAEDANNATHTRLSTVTSRRRIPVVLLFTLLLTYLGTQAWTYGLTDPDQTFQSPYCTMAPANYDPIIAYMQQEHIHYAWATNLLGYPIVFKTNSKMIVVDPLPLIHPAIAIQRIPSYTDAVKKADRPSFLVFVKHGNSHPYLLQLLDAEQVTYRVAFFPSEPGVDVMVVTPLSRTVSPFESKSFDIFYCSTQGS
jgi:uncharacterized SAM-binding protein YcdF (DUF218 family)